MAQDQRDETIDEFMDLVNMQPKELEEWLGTDESKSVGQKEGGGESKGHRSGRQVVEIKRKNKADYTDADLGHMTKVTSYIKRHRAQGPESDVRESDWRYSLMNWGHDPCKDDDVDC